MEKWESIASAITGKSRSAASSRKMSSRKQSEGEGIMSPVATIGGSGRKASAAAGSGGISKSDTLFDTKMEVTRIGEEEDGPYSPKEGSEKV